MRTYILHPVEGMPDWSKIPALTADHVLWEPDPGIVMQAQLCYDADRIYVRQRAWERDIRAELQDPLSPVCQDSCMEFFFGFARDGRYFNLEINPNGCIYFGFGGKRTERVRLILKDSKRLLSLQTRQETDGWSVTYSLPVSFLRQFYPELELHSGLRFWANCYKCGDKTLHPHFLSWNAVQSETPDFHRPTDFGEMILG